VGEEADALFDGSALARLARADSLDLAQRR
jgi:hypothetical protein